MRLWLDWIEIPGTCQALGIKVNTEKGLCLRGRRFVV